MIYAFFVKKAFLTKKFFLFAEINLTIGGPLYTCLVSPNIHECDSTSEYCEENCYEWKSMSWFHQKRCCYKLIKYLLLIPYQVAWFFTICVRCALHKIVTLLLCLQLLLLALCCHLSDGRWTKLISASSIRCSYQ